MLVGDNSKGEPQNTRLPCERLRSVRVALTFIGTRDLAQSLLRA
jgi:hypothetical protein